ncbi:hypothetical protein MTO96_009522 [Rhipicephalus appendiculatus]
MRLQALQLVYRPVILLSPGEWVPKKETFTALRTPLPNTVHVLTLERLGGPQVLLRLEHLAVTDDTVEVNVTRLLAGYQLVDVKAVTLGANQYLPGPTRPPVARDRRTSPSRTRSRPEYDDAPDKHCGTDRRHRREAVPRRNCFLPSPASPGPALGANQCELRGCPEHKPGYINMHVLSHSHMDVGWLQTVDEIYNSMVKQIYNSTIRGLAQNFQRRFVAAESAYFSRWWNEQSNDVKQMVRDMVNSGQLQFVGGGWVQNDEAVPHYTTIIDQMTLGLRFLNDTFGPQCGVPSVAWQADPFGHSVSQASLFARMGFGSLMIGQDIARTQG